VHSPVDVHEEVDRVGDEHDEPADEKILGDDQRPDGSTDRKGTDIAPEDPGRVVFEEEIGKQGTGQADKEQCIENIPVQECLEKERKEKDEREPGIKPVESGVHVDEVRNDRNISWYDELDID